MRTEMSWWKSRRFAAAVSVLALAWGVLWLVRPGKVPENVAYVSEEQGEISVIDLKTLKVVRRIDLSGAKPRGIGLTSDGRYLLTANKESADVSVIDSSSLRTVRRIPIGRNPEFLKLHPTGRWVFTSHEPGLGDGLQTAEPEKEGLSSPPSRIVAVDVRSWSIVKTFLAGSETEGIEFSRDGKFLIVTNEADNSIAVYEVESGKLVRKMDETPYGLRPRGVKVSPPRNVYAVTLEASGRLLLLDGNFEVTRSVQTGAGPYGVAFDREGRRLFVAAARAQALEVYDADSLQLLARVPVGQRCWHFTFTPDDSRLLIACGRSNDIHIIDAQTYRTIQIIKGFQMPWGIVTYPKAYGSLDLP